MKRTHRSNHSRFPPSMRAACLGIWKKKLLGGSRNETLWNVKEEVAGCPSHCLPARASQVAAPARLGAPLARPQCPPTIAKVSPFAAEKANRIYRMRTNNGTSYRATTMRHPGTWEKRTDVLLSWERPFHPLRNVCTGPGLV